MTIEFWFWLLAILTALSWLLGNFGPEPYRVGVNRGGFLILFILVVLLGWDYFGGPIKRGGSLDTGTRYVR